MLVPDLRPGQTLERAVKIVRGRKQVLGKACDRVFGCVLALALRPAARVFGLGQSSQKPLLVVCELGFERRQPFLGRKLGALLDVVVGGSLGRDNFRRLAFISIVDHLSYPMRRPITLAV